MGLFSRQPPPSRQSLRSEPETEPAADADSDEVLEPDAVIDPPESDSPNPLSVVPGLARVTASVIGHTGSWAAGAYLRAGKRVVGVVVDPVSGVELVRDIATETTRTIAAIAEATDLDRRLQEAGPAGEFVRNVASAVGSVIPTGTDLVPAPSNVPATQNGRREARVPTLREQGEDLLRRSRDVRDDYDAHPAYARILSELAPDEARILRLMLIDGPQPTVDVRTGGPLGLINSRLIAPGLSMIGARAGCRYIDRVPSYLNNLFRLGLVWFSRETLRDHQRYQVLEAQPDVLEAIHSVSAAKVVRRSVHLTPFGEDFCRVCLSDDVPNLDQLPEHSSPKESDTAPQPPTETVDG